MELGRQKGVFWLIPAFAYCLLLRNGNLAGRGCSGPLRDRERRDCAVGKTHNLFLSFESFLRRRHVVMETKMQLRLSHKVCQIIGETSIGHRLRRRRGERMTQAGAAMHVISDWEEENNIKMIMFIINEGRF